MSELSQTQADLEVASCQSAHYYIKIKKLEQDLKILRHALEQIRNEDYRGTRHNSHFIAKRALQETE